jgi:hypothetical protein
VKIVVKHVQVGIIDVIICATNLYIKMNGGEVKPDMSSEDRLLKI